MEITIWLRQQLQQSSDVVLWAVAQNPVAHYMLTPPRHPERWSLARIVFHLVAYERDIALPTMQQWLGGDMPGVGSMEDDAAAEEAAWQQTQPALDELLTTFQAGRSAQIALLAPLSDIILQEPRKVIWGERSLAWVIMKTLQHTFEHTDELLRMALWWQE